MTTPDVLDYDRAAWRIGRNLAVIASIGSVAGWAAAGWPWGAGFFLGSAISWVNYRWLRRVVENLGEAATGSRPKARARGLLVALRFLLVAGVAYVIVRYTPISKPAVL